MKKYSIKDIAYIIQDAKNKNQEKPIFFLGAGASESGGIPLAPAIAQKIQEEYTEVPRIKELDDPDKKDYFKIMEALYEGIGLEESNKTMEKYISKAKINVTHLYLASLLVEGYVDYVVTVNFDNLMLRALALFNYFPPIYDLVILKDKTTTTAFKKKSIIYLHGQYHSPWLLQTSQETKKITERAKSVFDAIKTGRTWIFIGYSGKDPVFNSIKNLGAFGRKAYWIRHNHNAPEPHIEEFEKQDGVQAMTGYDSDSFMLKLHSQLGLDQPKILDKPFSSLKEMLTNIVDIKDKEPYKGIKDRFKAAAQNVTKAIKQFEESEKKSQQELTREQKIDQVAQEITNAIIKGKYTDEILKELEEKAKALEDTDTTTLLSDLFFNRGFVLDDLAAMKEGNEKETFYRQAIENYQKATEIKPDNHQAYTNWGNVLDDLATMKEGNEKETFYRQAIENYQKATEIKPDNHQAYTNWGNVLNHLAAMKEGNEKETFYRQAIENYQKATEIKPDNHQAYYNWGLVLDDLATMKEGNEKETFYRQAIENYQKATEIKPDNHQAYTNWGNVLNHLAAMKEGNEKETFYRQAIENYQKATEIKPDNHQAYYNWGLVLNHLAAMKEGNEKETFYRQAIENYQKATEIKPDNHQAYYNWGNVLNHLAAMKEGNEKETFYRQAIENYQKATEIKPDNHQAYYNWGNVLNHLAAMKEGNEKETFYRQAIENYQKATEIKPDNHQAYTNWGNVLNHLAAMKEGNEKETFYRQAIENYQKATEIKPDNHQAYYNWGNVLNHLAAMKEGNEKETFYRQAIENYQKATEIKPDNHQAYTNWGLVLNHLAAMKEGNEKETFYRQAIENYQKATEYGGGGYNLACTYALLSDKKNALHYLENSLAKKGITVEFVKKDPDWTNFYQDKDFIALMKKYKDR